KEEMYDDLKLSIDTAKAKGIELKNFIVPYGAYNDDLQEVARQLFNGARRSFGGINYSPLETYALRSVTIGSEFESTNPFGSSNPTNSYEFYKEAVDQTIANNGWLIFMTHCAQTA